jgi:hypothetical protein
MLDRHRLPTAAIHGDVLFLIGRWSCHGDDRRSAFDDAFAASGHEKKSRGFAHVETWVFDLDNTLYPHHLNLWQQVDARIRSYIAEFLNISPEDAFRKQKDLYRRYGTTLRGMMTEHGMAPDDFLDLRPSDRSFADHAQSGARCGARTAAGPQAHPHQWHDGACERRDAAACRRSAFRGRVRHHRGRA